MATTPTTPRSRVRPDRRARFDAAGTHWEPPGDGDHGSFVAPEGDRDSLVRTLGWFSLGLGMAQILMPEKISALIGVDADNRRVLMRVIGVREVVSGLGILTQLRPTVWLWVRIAGDAIDLALLRSALTSPAADRTRVALATAATVGVTAADALCSIQLAAEPAPTAAARAEGRDVAIRAATTVNAPVAAVYSFWENFRALPRFMNGLTSVEVMEDGRTHWVMDGPAGLTVEWYVEIADAVPNEVIVWRTPPGSNVNAAGTVQFRAAPGNRGTEVRFDAQFSAPGGEIGKKIAELFASGLGVKLQSDLRRSKQLIELGEIVQSDDSLVPGPNPAQPVAHGSAA